MKRNSLILLLALLCFTLSSCQKEASGLIKGRWQLDIEKSFRQDITNSGNITHTMQDLGVIEGSLEIEDDVFARWIFVSKGTNGSDQSLMYRVDDNIHELYLYNLNGGYVPYVIIRLDSHSLIFESYTDNKACFHYEYSR